MSEIETIKLNLKIITWSEMDALCELIKEISTNDSGQPNDERYIAQCLIDWADQPTDK